MGLLVEKPWQTLPVYWPQLSGSSDNWPSGSGHKPGPWPPFPWLPCCASKQSQWQTSSGLVFLNRSEKSGERRWRACQIRGPNKPSVAQILLKDRDPEVWNNLANNPQLTAFSLMEQFSPLVWTPKWVVCVFGLLLFFASFKSVSWISLKKRSRSVLS